MTGTTADSDAGGGLSLVGEHRAHVAWFADDGANRRRAEGGKPSNQMRHAAAAGLLVIGEGQMDRLLQPGFGQLRNGGQSCGEIALHVGRTAPVKLFAVATQAERLRRPLPGLGLHDIHMAGDDIAGHIRRTDCREEVAAVAFRSGKHHRLHVMGLQIVADPADDFAVGRADDGGERHQLFQNFGRVHEVPDAAFYRL